MMTMNTMIKILNHINRIKVEFKLLSLLFGYKNNSHINRIKVEFKLIFLVLFHCLFKILIESKWNLNLSVSSTFFDTALHINRIKVEFK